MNKLLKISPKKMVNPQDIIYLKGFGNYTTYQFVNGESLTVAKTIKLLEMSMKSQQLFFRSHKSFLVNLDHILAVDEEKLTMTNNTMALVSRRRKSDLQINLKQNNL
jgi:two-component system, LytTR family, response regulator